MFKVNLEKINKKILIAAVMMLIPVVSLFSTPQPKTNAITFKGWSNYGWRGDKQAVGQVNGEGTWVGSTAYINNQCGQRWSNRSTGITTAYSDWCYGTAYSYWYYA